MSVFSIKNQLNQTNVEVATKQDTIVNSTALMVKDVSYKNQSGAETILVDYDSLLALEGVASANATKNSSQDTLITNIGTDNKTLSSILCLFL